MSSVPNDALYVLYATLRDVLTNANSLWSERVYADVAPPNVVRPYAIFIMASGGETNDLRHQDADFVLTIKCVADDMVESMDGAADLARLLNDNGQIEASASPVSAIAGSGWTIRTITQDRRIHFTEQWEDAVPIYHDGHQYQFVMEASK